jgi:phage host-nuclease inhibitor protein Gam
MSLQNDVAQIKESLKFLPNKFDELRDDIRRLAETFNEELEAEKKSDVNLKTLLSSWRRGSPSLRAEAGKENPIPGRSSPVRGLLKYLE